MGKRTKKVGICGKYGTRYGASLRKLVKKIEITQHSKVRRPPHKFVSQSSTLISRVRLLFCFVSFLSTTAPSAASSLSSAVLLVSGLALAASARSPVELTCSRKCSLLAACASSCATPRRVCLSCAYSLVVLVGRVHSTFWGKGGTLRSRCAHAFSFQCVVVEVLSLRSLTCIRCSVCSTPPAVTVRSNIARLRKAMAKE